MKTLTVIFLLSIVCLPVYGQYYGERVMEKSFEQTDFFFTPSYTNPLGIRGFTTALPGLVNDPLLNLQINPANLYCDSSHTTYTYVDFRSTRNVIDRAQYGYPWWGSRITHYDIILPYPRFFVTTRKQLDPVVSAAFLSRPFLSVPSLFVGVTYQMVFQNDKYYSIPQDIYKSAYGYDYTGTRVAETDIPIIDKYSGKDDMRQSGHFSSFYAGYQLSDELQIGGRASRVTFNRDGAFGSRNFNEYAYTSQSTSTWVWHNMETRSQDYSHWDLSGGVNYRNHDVLTIGVSAGFIIGSANQGLGRLDTSLYTYGHPTTGDYWNYSRRLASTDQRWDHDGRTRYGGVNVHYRVNERQSFVFNYSLQKQDVDIRLGSTIVDSSNYSYRSQWNNNTYTGDWRYRLTDFRSGTGTKNGSHHRALAGFQWKIESSIDLNIGLVYEQQQRETKTDEAVVASHGSFSYYISPGYNSNYIYGGGEAKTLRWNFTAERTTVQIPVLLTWKATERIEVLLGLNRQISDWSIEEVTLAVFSYRERNDYNGSTRKENFGERYTTPWERISDIRTTVLAGITVAPSHLFNVRLLLTPTQLDLPDGSSKSDYQWWIGLQLYP